MMDRLRGWARALKRDLQALFIASRDPRVPLLAKLVIGVTVAYALSPIDLIPDFIPVLGYLDDLLLLPLGIWLAVRLVPPEVWAECRAQALAAPMALPTNRLAAGAVIAAWVLATVGLSALLWRIVG